MFYTATCNPSEFRDPRPRITPRLLAIRRNSLLQRRRLAASAILTFASEPLPLLPYCTFLALRIRSTPRCLTTKPTRVQIESAKRSIDRSSPMQAVFRFFERRTVHEVYRRDNARWCLSRPVVQKHADFGLRREVYVHVQVTSAFVENFYPPSWFLLGWKRHEKSSKNRVATSVSLEALNRSWSVFSFLTLLFVGLLGIVPRKREKQELVRQQGKQWLKFVVDHVSLWSAKVSDFLVA